MSRKKHGEETQIVHAGYDPADYHGVVTPPVVRASTILYPSLAAYEDPAHKYRYGRHATPFTDTFTNAMAELERGYAAIAASSGLAAITTSLLAFTKSGDHVLVSDSIYAPTRIFCDSVLARMGVEVEYYDPLIGAAIAGKFKNNTGVIYMESPGSGTFEVQDVPAIAKAARARGIITLADNSWASGLLFRPLEHGVDVSILSCTKYIGGHSDIMLGAAVARTAEIFKILSKGARDLGACAGTEEIALALRGLRTLPVRMKEAGARSLKIARWLERQKGVARVYHPALPSDPNHKLWKRDFKGCNGLLSVLLEPAPKKAARAFVDGLELFPIGSSWGGYESLLQPQYLKSCRTAVPWTKEGFLVRLQVGLEDPDDLIADLEQALAKFNKLR
jgi:cysteine-S-conjugate beta-lyase